VSEAGEGGPRFVGYRPPHPARARYRSALATLSHKGRGEVSTSRTRASADSIFKQPTLRRPYSLRRRVRRRSRPGERGAFFSPSTVRGDGAPSGAPVFRLAALHCRERGRRSAPTRTSLRSPGLFAGNFCSPGPRFLGRGHCRPVPVQQAPCGAVVMPPDRGPRPPGSGVTRQPHIACFARYLWLCDRARYALGLRWARQKPAGMANGA
jgi:hypothetical protein